MITEQHIRSSVRKILKEEETRRPGRGGYKKEIREAGALAQKDPGELMRRLKINTATGNSDIEKLNNLLQQAVGGTPAMQAVYSEPQPRKDNRTNFEGVRVSVRVIPARDARKYLEHTLIGAQRSRKAIFDTEIQVEILGNDILLYFSPRPYSWGRQQTQARSSSAPKQNANESKRKNESGEILGEPDFNPDNEKDEVSLGGAVTGVVTPLGTGPTYPDKAKKKPKDPAEITGRAFGGAKPLKKKKKKTKRN